MTRLQELSNAELVEEAQRRAAQAKADDDRLGVALEDILKTVDELTKRLNDG